MNMRKKNQQGIGMIEVLVSMVLLGICVLGFAALQIRATETAGAANYRGQAATIAADFAERIRLNIAVAGAQDSVYQAYTSSANWSLASSKNCVSSTCSATELAQYDITQIKSLATTALPGGTVSVAQCSSGLNMCVYVGWNLTNVSSNATSCVDTNNQYQSFNTSCVSFELYGNQM